MPIPPPNAILLPLMQERLNIQKVIANSITRSFGIVPNGDEPTKLAAFFVHGLPSLQRYLHTILFPYGIKTTVSGIFCHQKPEVKPLPPPTTLHRKSCELGDALFLVTYGKPTQGSFLGNGILVQAKNNLNLAGGVQKFLYEQANGFSYFRTTGLNQERRCLNGCANSLWYWNFASQSCICGWNSCQGTTANCARRPSQSKVHATFDCVLTQMMCGFRGRRFRKLANPSHTVGWSRIVDDLIRVTAKTYFNRAQFRHQRRGSFNLSDFRLLSDAGIPLEIGYFEDIIRMFVSDVDLLRKSSYDIPPPRRVNDNEQQQNGFGIAMINFATEI